MSTIESITPEIAPARWAVDPANSTVEFAVKTFWGAMTVRGRFEQFDGSYDVTPDGKSIHLTIDAGSLDTGHAKRDEHLRSADFFKTTDHPQVRFHSTRVDDLGRGLLRVHGQLEAAGTAVPLEFDAQVAESGSALEFDATAVVDPQEFEMSRGMLNMIRPPAILHVKARVVPTQPLAAAA